MKVSLEAQQRNVANLTARHREALANAAQKDHESEEAMAMGEGDKAIAASDAAKGYRDLAQQIDAFRLRAQGLVATLIAERADDQRRAEEADAEKASAALAKRLEREWPRITAPILALLDDLRTDQERMTALNERRRAAGLPPLMDAEQRVRMTEARTVPAAYGEAEILVDAAGKRPAVMYPQADGTFRDGAGSTLRRETERYLIHAERIEPARMPERLAETVVLPPLREGGQ